MVWWWQQTQLELTVKFTQKPSNAISGVALLVAVQWNLSKPRHPIPPKLVLWLDNNEVWVTSKSGSLKVAVYLLGGLFILLIITTTLLLGDHTFYSPGEGPWMYCVDYSLQLSNNGCQGKLLIINYYWEVRTKKYNYTTYNQVLLVRTCLELCVTIQLIIV